MIQLTAEAALVTGASRGIGAATAVAFARAGVRRLGLHYGSSREGAEETLVQVRDAGADGVLLPGDFTTDGGIAGFLDLLRAELPEVDLLVNNAGSLVRRAPLRDSTAALFDEIMNLNAKSTWLVSQAVVPHMLQRGAGSIINLSSIAARNGGGLGATLYAAAKAAVSTMTKGMAKELAPHGIRVNAVSPGTVDNDFHRRFSTPQMLESVTAMTPAGRLATNEEIADVILFLCSDQARYVHGQTIELNGAMFMP